MLAVEGSDEEILANERDAKLSSKPLTAINSDEPHPSRQRLVFADPAAFR